MKFYFFSLCATTHSKWMEKSFFFWGFLGWLTEHCEGERREEVETWATRDWKYIEITFPAKGFFASQWDFWFSYGININNEPSKWKRFARSEEKAGKKIINRYTLVGCLVWFLGINKTAGFIWILFSLSPTTMQANTWNFCWVLKGGTIRESDEFMIRFRQFNS